MADTPVEIHWHINSFCNYSCGYCFFGHGAKDPFPGPPDIEKTLKAFDGLDFTCLVNISGGEPFFAPDFVDLCAGLTRRHSLSVNTNLSHPDIYRFAASIDPERVLYLNCSVHIPDLEKKGLMADFINKFNHLRERGFTVFATYVMHPALLKRFESDYLHFKSEGIILRPKIFRGKYGPFQGAAWRPLRKLSKRLEKTYPNAYSKNRKRIVMEYIDRSQREDPVAEKENDHRVKGRMLDVACDRLFIDGLPSFKGLKCLAGSKFIRVDKNGEAFRCHGSNDSMGNLFESGIKLLPGAKPCPSDVCICPYLGYVYVEDGYKESGRLP